jgi:hypothetical protein
MISVRPIFPLPAQSAQHETVLALLCLPGPTSHRRTSVLEILERFGIFLQRRSGRPILCFVSSITTLAPMVGVVSWTLTDTSIGRTVFGSHMSGMASVRSRGVSSKVFIAFWFQSIRFSLVSPSWLGARCTAMSSTCFFAGALPPSTSRRSASGFSGSATTIRSMSFSHESRSTGRLPF